MTDPGFGPPLGNPLEYANFGAELPYKKWRTRGTIFGVIAIVIGSGGALMGLLVPLALLAPTQRGAPAHVASTLFSAAMLYLAIGGALIWIGIGSLKMLRWSRPLILIAAAITIILGIFSIVSMVLLAPAMQSFTPPSRPGVPAPPSQDLTIILAITVLFLGTLLVGIPALFIWAFKPAEMKAAQEYLDPNPRWTDPCPIPVLALVVFMILYALMLLLGVPRAILPVFGTILHGPPAVAVILAFAAAAFLLARLAYQIRLAAWWGSITFFIVVAVAYGMTAIKSNLVDLYRAAGFNDTEIDAITKFQHLSGTWRLGIWLVWVIMAVAYLAYIRQYFVTPSPIPEKL